MTTTDTAGSQTTMRALVARPSAPRGIELGEVEAPRPAPDEALVEVRAVSLNKGEARYLPRREEGTVHGCGDRDRLRDLFRRPPTTFNAAGFYNRRGARLYGLRVFDGLDRHHSAVRDLRFLAEKVAVGRLDPQISLAVSWREAGAALDALVERRVRGKAVLTID